MVEKILLNANELAHAIGVKVSTVRFWACYSTIPTVRIGRLVRYRLQDILAWIESGGPQHVQRPLKEAA